MVKIDKPAPSPFTLALHTEIRAWAGRRGLSFRRLAEESGINKNKIHRTVSSDQASLDTDELDAICQALKINPKDLVEAAVAALERQSREQTEPTYQEILEALKTQEEYEAELAQILADVPEDYDLAAKKARKLRPGEERGVEYYE